MAPQLMLVLTIAMTLVLRRLAKCDMLTLFWLGEGVISAVVPPPGKSFSFITEKSFNYQKWTDDFSLSNDQNAEVTQELCVNLVSLWIFRLPC